MKKKQASVPKATYFRSVKNERHVKRWVILAFLCFAVIGWNGFFAISSAATCHFADDPVEQTATSVLAASHLSFPLQAEKPGEGFRTGLSPVFKTALPHLTGFAPGAKAASWGVLLQYLTYRRVTVPIARQIACLLYPFHYFW